MNSDKINHQPKIEILSNGKMEYNYKFKVIIIGDAAVGKTSLTKKQ